MKNILVTGSSGFIGGHLVKKLKAEGNYVIGVDIVPPKYGKPDRFLMKDLRYQESANYVFNTTDQISEVYNLACLMGGMGFIGDDSKAYDILAGSSLIVSNVLDAALRHDVKKIFYSSSACIYNQSFQEETEDVRLNESMDYPANPDLVYGWQKLFGEQMMQAADKSYNANIRIARFHNIFGPEGVYEGGKEKAPAALCRKVAMAEDGDEIEVWGDGKQTRSFLYIDECLKGIELLMASSCKMPLNIGSDYAISINDLAKTIIKISGKRLTVKNVYGTQGVRGRSSDNRAVREILGWAPDSNLEAGLEKTYSWINKQIHSK
jgi:nucleoside-diphosphate-sugar epimerase